MEMIVSIIGIVFCFEVFLNWEALTAAGLQFHFVFDVVMFLLLLTLVVVARMAATRSHTRAVRRVRAQRTEAERQQAEARRKAKAQREAKAEARRKAEAKRVADVKAMRRAVNPMSDDSFVGRRIDNR